MLAGVLSSDVDNAWGEVAPMLQRALDKSQHDYDLDYVYNSIVCRDMQLWVWIEAGKIEAAAVTQIIDHPLKRICAMPLIGGRFMRHWLGSEDQFIAWAKAQGCTQIEGYCRDGWIRILKNWKKAWTTMRRDI